MKKRMVALCMAAVLAFAVTACGGDDVAAYRESINSIITEVQDMDSQVNDAVQAVQDALNNQDEAAYEEQLEIRRGHSDTLKEKYQAIANEKAPEEYAQDQEQLKEYADQLGKMLDASMEMYEIAYRYAVTQDVTDEEVERLSELQEEIASYAEAADGFDEVLNRIMGNTEE